MRRRAFLATGLAAATAGCLSDEGDDEPGGDTAFQDPDFDVERNEALPGEAPDPDASRLGLALEPEAVDAPGVDVDALDTYDRYEESVPLLPVEDAYAWYRRRDARFVDARAASAYENSRVTGSALSPAPDGQDADDPVANWADGERIVTYCGCPHHLSGWRSSKLRCEGRPAVFAIDEGFGQWVRDGYPTTSGSETRPLAAERSVSGRVDPAYAGEFVWVRDETTEQVEPGVVGRDGSFRVHFRFAELDASDPITVETPAWSRTGPVADLTDGAVRDLA